MCPSRPETRHRLARTPPPNVLASPLPAHIPRGSPIASHVPSFHLLKTQPPRPGAFLLGAIASLLFLSAVIAALGHSRTARRHGHPAPDAAAPAAGPSASGIPVPGNDDDDPDAFDTVVLADPSDAPIPASKGDHVSPVHPFAVVHLPRFGPDAGMIPDTPTGRALYTWLAAFNHGDPAGLATATGDSVAVVAAQLELRRQTGGLALLSAKQIAPGLMIVRMRDQTTQTELLGTLQLRPTTPAAIASFSLRAISKP